MLRGTMPPRSTTRAGSRSRTPSGRSRRAGRPPGLRDRQLHGRIVRIYPMPVWQALEAKLAKMPYHASGRRKFSTAATTSARSPNSTPGPRRDPAALRDAGGMTGEVDVLGKANPRSLEPRPVRREARRAATKDDYTDADARALCGVRDLKSRMHGSRTGDGGRDAALARAGARRRVRRLHGRAGRPLAGAARGRRRARRRLDRDAEALAHGARAAGAVRRSRRARARRLSRPGAVLDARGLAAVDGVARRSRRVVDAARRDGARLQLPRATRRSTCGWIAAQGPTAADLLATSSEDDARRRDFRVRRGAATRGGSRAPSSRARDAGRSTTTGGSRRSCAARCRAAATSGSIRRRARSRRCASG